MTQSCRKAREYAEEKGREAQEAHMQAERATHEFERLQAMGSVAEAAAAAEAAQNLARRLSLTPLNLTCYQQQQKFMPFRAPIGSLKP